MPRRTNPFQNLITRIQAALHGKRAKVEESAMVYNYDTETETEVDILITFDLGGTCYRTVVECRDQSRPAGPSWIAELKAKRDGCRLDKMIAIHSKGFTKPAVTLAEKDGIETLTPEKGSKVNWTKEILPFETLLFQTILCEIPDGLLFSLSGVKPSRFDTSTSFILFPDKSSTTINDFINQVREKIRTHYSKLSDLTGKKITAVEEKEIHKTVDLFITFPSPTMLKPTEGQNLTVQSARALAFVTIKTIVIDSLEHISLKDSIRATHADFELMGHKANVTLTEKEDKPNELGVCLYWEGGTFSGPPEKVGETERKPSTERGIRIYLRERE